jgi:hypothetical protein
MLSFKQKRDLQKLILEQNKILAGAPSFAVKRAAQKAKLDALTQLGAVKRSYTEKLQDLEQRRNPDGAGKTVEELAAEHTAEITDDPIKQPSSTETAEINASGENSGSESNEDQSIDLVSPEENLQDIIANKQSSARFYNFDPNRKKSQRKKDNAAALAILNLIDASRLDPANLDEEQRAALAKYSGTGGALIDANGKKGSAYEYYTPKPIAEGMWGLMRELGFSGGKVLDPSSGVGIFGGTAPNDAAVDAVELNEVSGRINGLVNSGPGNSVTISPFEEVAASTPDGAYDAIITNVPFGSNAARGGNQFKDKRYQDETLENYFILRSMEKLKPGGLAVFITPPRCVSGKGASESGMRQRVSYMAEFLGAYRLPNSVFGTADADTITDVIAFRKFSAETLEKIGELREQAPEILSQAKVVWDEFVSGDYFKGEGRRFVLGEFVPKDPNKFRDVDRVVNDKPVGEVAQMLNKFPDSRIDWALLETAETAPIIYQEGDTITQAGQTLQLQDGSWVALKKTDTDAELLALLKHMTDPYTAFEHNVSYDDAMKVVNYMNAMSKTLDIPDWLRGATSKLNGMPEYWWAGVVGLSVAQVLHETAGSGEVVNYLEQYAALSEAMERVYTLAKSVPVGLAGDLKDGMKILCTHYSKKKGFSAVWRGDVLDEVQQNERTADQSFEGLRYNLKSSWVPLADASQVMGEDFNPLESADFCLSGDGGSITKAGDYYVGNYGEFLRRLDREIAATEDAALKAKLLRQKTDAAAYVDRVDPGAITFNLFSPYVTIEEKAEFLRRFVDPRFAVSIENSKGETVDPFIILDGKRDKDSDKDKLLARLAQYLKNGTITLGGAQTTMSSKQALNELRKMVNTANEQFGPWVKSNRAIMDRITRTANDPDKLRFRPIDDESAMPIPGLNNTRTPHGYQFSFIRKQGREFGGINGFNVGLGKAQPLDAKILTPSGWVLMGDIQVGDAVIAADGTPTTVTGVFPQGEKEIFAVEFSDGSKTRCCDEHLWFTETENDRQKTNYHARNGREKRFGSVKSLAEIKSTLIHGKKQKNHSIPIAYPAQMNARDFVIDPYVLGVILGDGCIKFGTVSFTPGDDLIADRVSGIIAESGLLVEVKKIAKQENRSQSYAISQGNIGGSCNPVKESLRQLGIDGLGSHEKFVPKSYLFASVSQRVELLRGLMDTDGYVSKDGITVQFSSSSERLANDVRHLVQSLSGIAWISTKLPKYTHHGEKRIGRLCYTVSIRMPPGINPFWLKRKADRVVPKSKYLPVRYFTKVESVGVEPAQCISIDHPSRLYVTDDFIVTHNTLSALAAVQHAHNIGVKKKTLFVVPNSVLSNWRKEAMAAYETVDNCLFIGLRTDKAGKDVVKSSAYDEDLLAIRENRHSKIFVTMEAFERIRLKEETITAFGDFLRQVDASFAESELNAEEESTKSKHASLMELLRNKTGSAPFLEDLGIDSVVIDEAHAMKNAAIAIDTKKARYLSLSKPSGRGFDAQAKAWYIRGQSPLKDGVLLLTATPITNSPLEIFSMMSLAVGHERVNDTLMGIRGADNFLSVVCDVQSESDVSIDGIDRDINVFQGLNNVTMLRKALLEIADIKDADDVGAQIVVPEEDPKPVSIQLPDDVKARLIKYKGAFRYAVDMLSERKENRGDRDAYDEVSAYFGESALLIGHPFNLINKMTLLIADPELDARATFYTFSEAQKDLAAKVVNAFNAKKIKERRAREMPLTRPEMVVGRKRTVDPDTEEVSIELTIQVEATIQGNKNRIAIDTMDAKTQSTFEAIAEKEGLDLDVTVPPKVAALLENFQNEAANPRGMDADGNKIPFAKQIIFCDILPLHNKIKRILSKRAGVPSSAIAIITGQTNNSPDEILDVQNGFNASGEDNKYRVIIANEKAEVGINLQIGTQAIHHLTIGWTPDSLTQRNGRGVRQGNKTEHVSIYHYDADGTFDVAKRSMVGKKAEWIDLVMDVNGGDKVAVTGGLSREQMEALIDTVGDADGMTRLQESIAAKEAEARAATNRDKQLVNISTVQKQLEFMKEYPDAGAWVIRKVQALYAMDVQLKNLRARLKNAKTETAAAKNQAAIADIQVRFDGLMRQVDTAATLYGNYKYPGVRELLDEIPGFYRGRGETINDVIKSRLSRAGGVTVNEDSELQSDWRAEFDMAQSLIAESVAGFKKRAGDAGAYPSAIIDKVAAGESSIIFGKPVVIGAFMYIDGTLAVVTTLTGAGTAKGWIENENGGRENGWYLGDALKNNELIYPGTAAYVDALIRAAQIEDKLANAGITKYPYSDAAPEVKQYRKNVGIAEYSLFNNILPSPYFPVVITEDKAKTPIMRSIFESQKPVIKGFNYSYFKVAADVEILEKPKDFDWLRALKDYALAHGVQMIGEDVSQYGYSFRQFIGESVNVTEFAEAIKADTAQKVKDKANQFIAEKLVSWFDSTGVVFGVNMPLPYDLGEALRNAVHAANMANISAETTTTTSETAAPTESPNDVVAVSGSGTRRWKDDLKEYGTRHKPAGYVKSYYWDGANVQWLISRAAWNAFIADNPQAAESLTMKPSFRKTI